MTDSTHHLENGLYVPVDAVNGLLFNGATLSNVHEEAMVCRRQRESDGSIAHREQERPDCRIGSKFVQCVGAFVLLGSAIDPNNPNATVQQLGRTHIEDAWKLTEHHALRFGVLFHHGVDFS